MNRHIVVAFRMPPAAMSPGPEGGYLSRARSLCARGEALGGRLVAWSAAIAAMAWDTDSIEEAVLLATSMVQVSTTPPGGGRGDQVSTTPPGCGRAVEEARSEERAWAVGIAEGELEPLAPDGARMQLAWGQALLLATTLSRVARGGEVLVDGEVPALRTGRLSVLGARTATDQGLLVRGWRLDLGQPWKPAPPASVVASPPVLRGEPSRIEEGGTLSSRCHAALALAMTLSTEGRAADALLEALDALARAREASDPKAIDACTALLAKLYSGAGHPSAAAALRAGAGASSPRT